MGLRLDRSKYKLGERSLHEATLLIFMHFCILRFDTLCFVLYRLVLHVYANVPTKYTALCLQLVSRDSLLYTA